MYIGRIKMKCKELEKAATMMDDDIIECMVFRTELHSERKQIEKR